MAAIAVNDLKTNIHLSFSPNVPLFSITFSGGLYFNQLSLSVYTSDYILLITMVYSRYEIESCISKNKYL